MDCMNIVVNGTERVVDAGVTLARLLEQLGLDPKGLAAAVNAEVVPRPHYADRVLRAGDRVELVRAVGGG